ncbi:DegT/DnrJ/EryC1/StrS family aminotransferase [Amedibacillus sp. YH-ame6]
MNEKILVTRSSMPEFQEYIDEISDLWDSHWLTNMGKHHQELEEKLKKYLKVDGVSLFSNGHMALELALQALELDGEVITTPFTFVSTTHAIVRNGLKPVFCDINKDNYTIDANKIEALITDKTVAILPVHVYGNICDVNKINEIAKRNNIKVIYDAAHAFGITVEGKGICEYGDLSMLSFHATKVFNTIEGGAICYNQILLGEKLAGLKNFGIRDETTVDCIGANSKMNEFQAAMGVCNLRHIDGEILKRKRIVERYKSNLSNIDGIILMKEYPQIESNYAYFPVLFNEEILGFNRDDVYELLKVNDIVGRKYFYPLINDMDCYKYSYSSKDTPIAKYVAERILTLPLYAELSVDVVDKICDLIKSMF